MSNRTYGCLDCEKSNRRDQNDDGMDCPICKKECEYVHWKIHIPSPKRKKKWKTFWEQYRKEKRYIEEFKNNPDIKEVKLEILNQILIKVD